MTTFSQMDIHTTDKICWEDLADQYILKEMTITKRVRDLKQWKVELLPLVEKLKEDTRLEAAAMVNFMENLQPRLLDDQARRQCYRIEPVRWLALAGGGAKGPGEIGVLEAMERLGHRFEGFSGTSIGAILAALAAVGYSAEELAKEFNNKPFEDFLDHPLKGKKLTDLLPSHPTLGSLSKNLQEMRKFVSNPVKYGMGKAKELMTAIMHVKGLCSGEALRDWIEELIFKKTDIRHLTFGELAEKKIGKLPQLKTAHLFVSMTSITSGGEQLVCMNTFDPGWQNYIISDAARSSAGYPGAFKPHAPHIKVNNDRVKIEGVMHVDGGMLSNGATLPLDEVRFIKGLDGEEGRRPEFNRGVIAVSFLSSACAPKKAKTDFTIIDLLKGLIDTYMSAEQILNTNPYHETRAIKVPTKVETISFPTLAQKAEMIASGKKAAEDFFFRRAQQREAVRTVLSPVYRDLPDALCFLPPTHPQFSGRESELTAMKKHLCAEIKGTNNELLLYGSEGMGKSLLATAFANQHRKHFKLIWTINCHDPELRAASYISLAETLNIPIQQDSLPTIVQKVHRALEAFKQPWLLIFDNLGTREPLSSSSSSFATRRSRR